MAIYGKAITTNDIVIGLATVCTGQKTQYLDLEGGSGLRTMHWGSGESLKEFQTLNSRYHYHGGTGGSGNWEH